MAKSKDGFFGKLSGKVGNIVLASWKGIPYIRSKPVSNNSNTRAQQNQRSKFGMAVKFVDRIRPVINAGFKWNIDRMTERNSAISYITKNAVKGEKPDLWIDYSSVLVARGNLPPPREATAERQGEDYIQFRWEYDSELAARRASDLVLALAYCPDVKKGAWSVGGSAVRSDQMVQLAFPENMVGKELEAYLAFASPDRTDASDSVYVGPV